VVYQPLRANPLVRFVLEAVRQEKVYLLPLRLFIGVGWLRAGLEKWLEPGWHDGSALAHFLEAQVAGGQVAFPFYAQLVQTVFEPASLTLGLLIMVCQFLVGLAVIAGTFTNLALLGGLFMNLNFILIGEVDPSAFYVVIQVVLLLSNIGATLGLDTFLGSKVRFFLLVAKPADRRYSRLEKSVMGSIVALSLVGALSLIPSIEAFGPASVHDPVTLLFILALFTAAFFLTTLLHAQLRAFELASRTDKSITADAQTKLREPEVTNSIAGPLSAVYPTQNRKKIKQ